MKNQIYVLICTFIIIGLPNVKGLVTPDSMKDIKYVSLDDNAPVWDIGNSWTYDVNRFQANFTASGALIGFDTSIDDLIVELIGYPGSSYILGLSGRIKGTFRFESGEGRVLKGNLLFTKISGDIKFRQSDLAVEELHIVIKGIVLLTEYSPQIQIPIPFPLTITINVIQITPRPVIDFPLYDGKEGMINETSISTNIKFGSIVLQILSLFIGDIPNEIFCKETFNLPMFDYNVNSENISVGAGNFNAYNIGFVWGLFGSVFYAPSVGNFVKAETVIEIPDQFQVLFLCELISYNYK